MIECRCENLHSWMRPQLVEVVEISRTDLEATGEGSQQGRSSVVRDVHISASNEMLGQWPLEPRSL